LINNNDNNNHHQDQDNQQQHHPSPHSGPVLRRAMTDSWRPILQQLTNELERQTQRLRELEAQRLVDLSVSWNHGRAWPGWPVFCGSFFLGGKSGMAVDLKTRWVFDTI